MTLLDSALSLTSNNSNSNHSNSNSNGNSASLVSVDTLTGSASVGAESTGHHFGTVPGNTGLLTSSNATVNAAAASTSALAVIGTIRPLQSLDETSSSVRNFRVVYDPCLDSSKSRNASMICRYQDDFTEEDKSDPQDPRQNASNYSYLISRTRRAFKGTLVPARFERDSNSVVQHGVLISHLAFTTTALDLEILFAGCGDILDILIEKHPATGAGLGFGRVVFAGPEAEAAAKKAADTLHGKQMERGPLKVILDGGGSKFRRAKANVAARIEAAKAKAAESSHDRDIYTNDDDMEIDDASTPPPSNMLSPCSNHPSANSSTTSLPASTTVANSTLNPATTTAALSSSISSTPSASKPNQGSTIISTSKRTPIPLPPNPRTRIPLPPIPPPELHQVKGAKTAHKEDGEIDDSANKLKSTVTSVAPNPTRAPLPALRREWDKGLEPPPLADNYNRPPKLRDIDPYRPSAEGLFLDHIREMNFMIATGAILTICHFLQNGMIAIQVDGGRVVVAVEADPGVGAENAARVQVGILKEKCMEWQLVGAAEVMRRRGGALDSKWNPLDGEGIWPV
ncbi:histone methyltransferase set1 [Modicella reniformis]|uniref:Histone methyltransferase set1 n=1 Tax=Modicella reniformis TaxID=1440133 RepID=A0A9P6M9K5_9FUNG|nr:histone methyltransferase set1 [Modicella reniformis]